MEQKNFSRPMSFLRYMVISGIAVFFVTVGVYAATTISNNIVTGGTLDVTGLSTLTTATATQATSSTSLWVGSGGTPNWLNLAGGDLFVQDDVQIGDALIVGGKATSTSLIVTGNATTTNFSIGERVSQNATNTLMLGDVSAESATCIKMRTTSGAWIYAYATSTADMLLRGLVWTVTSCE